jgi:hypothetical protein
MGVSALAVSDAGADAEAEAALGVPLVCGAAHPAINTTTRTKHRRREVFLPTNILDIFVSPLYYLLVVN